MSGVENSVIAITTVVCRLQEAALKLEQN